MIIKSFETNKININTNNFILMHGENEGFKEQTINKLASGFNERTIYEEREILEDTNYFLENILNKSLFSDQQIFIIKRASDKIYKIIEQVILKKITDIIIINSENLDKRSKLRSLFEKEKELVCIPFYTDNEQTLTRLIFDFLKKKNINISQSNINKLISKSHGKRENLINDLTKIEFYSKNRSLIPDEVVEKLINLSENYNISEIIDSCLSKNNNKLIKILNENTYSSDDSILILRSLLIKSKKILILAKEYEKNKNIDLTISTAKPPIFWKEKETTKRQIQSWKPQKLRLLIYKINELELIVKKNFNNSLNLITDFLLTQSVSKN